MNIVRASLIAVVVIVLSLVALRQQTPPAALSTDAPAGVFSSARAIKLLRDIGSQPHPIGSVEHARVRERIVQELTSLGVAPELQTATTIDSKGGTIRGATVQNVIARLKGTGNEKAVLLVGHYDTVPNSPGASDNGSGVATMLETLRALKAGPALKNDVIVLFTDGEEVGLLGARAFVSEHPYAKDVGAVLNFEARGSNGPVFMFETSGGNGQLIEKFAEVTPHPRANSLAYEVYKRLPNTTDFSVFKEARLPGLNFAFIDGFMRYHTQADSLENIDERSLQHHGSYALSLARRFGDESFNEVSSDGDSIYTDILGLKLVRYPVVWALPLLMLLTVVLVAVGVLGLKRGRLTVKGMLLGVVAFAVSIIAAPVIASAIWWLISAIQSWLGRGLQDDLYQSKIYFAGFIALSIAVVTTLYTWFGKKVRAEDLVVGSLCCWLVLLAATTLLVPGASYLMTLTLPFGIITLAFIFTAQRRSNASLITMLVVCLCAVPAIVLLVPHIYNVFAALGLGAVWAWTMLTAALVGLCVPHFSLVAKLRRWAMPAASTLAGVCLLLVAGFTFDFNESYPKTNHLFYALNSDTGKAAWASMDDAPDEWTAQFLSSNPQPGDIAEYMPLNSGRFLIQQAPPISLSKAQVKLMSETENNDARVLDLSIVPARAGVNLLLFVEPTTDLLSAALNGKRVGEDNPNAGGRGTLPRSIQYWAVPAEGLRLTLEVKAPRPFKLYLVERSYGLPEIPGQSFKPRPDYLMPSQSSTADATLLSTSYSF